MEAGLCNRVETINGTALAGEDYKPFDEVVTFEKHETLKSIFIEIVDDFEWEPDEFFFVKIHKSNDDITLGNISICQITIINDDGKHVLQFVTDDKVICHVFLLIFSKLMKNS